MALNEPETHGIRGTENGAQRTTRSPEYEPVRTGGRVGCERRRKATVGIWIQPAASTALYEQGAPNALRNAEISAKVNPPAGAARSARGSDRANAPTNAATSP